MAENTKYIPCYGKGDINCLKVEVGYELGGANIFSGANSQRGYYLYVRALRREKHSYGYSESYDLFGSAGKKMLLKAVKRKSAKALADAIKLAEQSEKELIDAVCREAGLTLGSPAA